MTSTLAASGIDTSASPARALVCRDCRRRYPLAAQHACYECFGPLEVGYDAAALATVTREQIEAGPQNIWRYAAAAARRSGPGHPGHPRPGPDPAGRAPPRLAAELGITRAALGQGRLAPTRPTRSRTGSSRWR